MLRGRRPATEAMPCVTVLARGGTPSTAGTGAAVAVLHAAVTERVTTQLTQRQFVLADAIATGVTADSVQVREGHVGTAGVVGLKHLADDHEVIAQPSGAQCLLEWQRRIPFAKNVLQDAGMCDIVPCGGTPGFQRHDLQFVTGAQAGPVPDELEGSERKFVEHDVLGGYRSCLTEERRSCL